MSRADLLQALEREAAGDWEAAHAASQLEDTPDAHWLHAYLHRREGDEANAAYWYRRAGRPVPDMDLDAEREVLRRAFSG